jgi:exonuclease III
MILNINLSNVVASKFKKQTFLNIKEQINSDTIIRGDLNVPLSSIHRTSREKNQKGILDLNNTIGKMNLTDNYRVFCPTALDYTLFSAAHGTFTK